MIHQTRTLRPLLALGLFLSLLAIAPASGNDKRDSDFVQKVSGPGIRLPLPIKQANLFNWLEREDAPDSSNAPLIALLEAYDARIDSEARPKLPELWRQVEAANPLPKPSQEYAASLKAVYATRRQIVEAITRADQQLFAEIETILSEPDLPRLEWAKLNRKREFFSPSPDALHLPRAKPDLLTVIHEIDPVLNRDSKLRPVLFEYLKARLSASELFLRENERAGLKSAELLAARSLLDPEDHESLQHIDEERLTTLKRSFDRQRRMAATNEQYAPAIEAALEPELARRFRIGWLARAYPKVYPHRRDPELRIKSILELPELTDDLKAQCEGMVAAFRTRYAQINTELEKEHDRLAELIYQQIWLRNDTQATHQQHVRSLLDTRDDVTDRLFQSMEEMLTPEQIATLPPLPKKPEPGSRESFR